MTEPPVWGLVRANMRPLRPHKSDLQGEQALQMHDSAIISHLPWAHPGKKLRNPASLANDPQSSALVAPPTGTSKRGPSQSSGRERCQAWAAAARTLGKVFEDQAHGYVALARATRPRALRRGRSMCYPHPHPPPVLHPPLLFGSSCPVIGKVTTAFTFSRKESRATRADQ